MNLLKPEDCYDVALNLLRECLKQAPPEEDLNHPVEKITARIGYDSPCLGPADRQQLVVALVARVLDPAHSSTTVSFYCKLMVEQHQLIELDHHCTLRFIGRSHTALTFHCTWHDDHPEIEPCPGAPVSGT